MLDGVRWGGRSAALMAFATAAVMVGLIASLAGGGMPPPIVLDVLSVGAAAGALIVVVIAYAGVVWSAWGQAGRALALSGMTLVLAGDAFQAVATRATGDTALMWAVAFAIRDGVGNTLFYVSLIVLGALLWSSHRWVGGLAVANGLLGFVALAVADRIGVPPHLNFLLLVVWFVVIGVAWWRAPSTDSPTERGAIKGEAATPA